MKNQFSPFYLFICLFGVSLLIAISHVNAQQKQPKNLPGDNEWYLRSFDNVKLYMYEFGTGKDTVLVLHGGFGANHDYLFTALQPLADKYHFVLYDQRGSLLSPCPDSLLSVENMCNDIESIRKELHIQKLTILSHSMGSWQASYYLQKYPDHVRGLVLCALYEIKNYDHPQYQRWSKRNDSLLNEFQKRPAYWEEVHKLGLQSDSVKNLPAKTKSQLWRIKFASVNLYHADRWKQMEGGSAFYNNHTGQVIYDKMPKDWDFTETYKRYRVPITIINGDYDFSDFDGEQYAAWLKGIINVKYIIIPHAGHNAWIDEPVIFTREVDDGLRRSFR